MIVQSNQDIDGIKKCGQIVALVRDKVISCIEPGITSKELDNIAGKELNNYGAKSAPIKDYNYPGFICVSINEEIAHGIPRRRVIQSGDIVNIDVSAEFNGYYADTGKSVVVGRDPIKEKVCNVALLALENAIKISSDGTKLNQIGRVIEETARTNSLKVIKNLTGHGIGRRVHEEPEYIYNYYKADESGVLKSGMVLAIESFISNGADTAYKKGDNWSIYVKDDSIVAQMEHTIIITEKEPIIVTKV